VEEAEVNSILSFAGMAKKNVAPGPAFRAAHKRPPWASTRERLIRSPIPAGEPYPLGGSLTEAGVKFALYSGDATAFELCLFDSPEPDAGELRIPVIEQIWHVFLSVSGPAQLSC